MAKKRKGGRNKGRRMNRSALLKGEKPEIIKKNGVEQWAETAAKEKDKGKTMKQLTDNHVKEIITAKENSPEGEGQKFQDKFKGSKSTEGTLKQIFSERNRPSPKMNEQGKKEIVKSNKKSNEPIPTDQKSQKPQSKRQPIATQKEAQNAQQEQTRKGIISKIAEEVKNVDFKKVAKVAGPLISRLGGKYGAAVAAGVGLAAEIIGEKRNGKEQKQTKEGKGNEKITSLKSIASSSTLKSEGKKPAQEITKKVGKGSSKRINSLKQESQVKKAPTPTKKPPTPRR